MNDVLDRETMAKALFKLACQKAEDDCRRYGLAVPPKWADPWNPIGGGERQRQAHLSDADFIIKELAK